MSSQTESWYFVKDDMLYRHTENDGWRAMRHGIESRNEEIMSVEQAKTRCPDILREAMNNIVCKIEGENDD
jgi:hypothetical protein